jgi:hypothetical protein
LTACTSPCTVATTFLAGVSSPTQDDVTARPPGQLFSEANDNSVAILLTHGTARILLAGNLEAREEYMTGGLYTEPLTIIYV